MPPRSSSSRCARRTRIFGSRGGCRRPAFTPCARAPDAAGIDARLAAGRTIDIALALLVRRLGRPLVEKAGDARLDRHRDVITLDRLVCPTATATASPAVLTPDHEALAAGEGDVLMRVGTRVDDGVEPAVQRAIAHTPEPSRSRASGPPIEGSPAPDARRRCSAPPAAPSHRVRRGSRRRHRVAPASARQRCAWPRSRWHRCPHRRCPRPVPVPASAVPATISPSRKFVSPMKLATKRFAGRS